MPPASGCRERYMRCTIAAGSRPRVSLGDSATWQAVKQAYSWKDREQRPEGTHTKALYCSSSVLPRCTAEALRLMASSKWLDSRLFRARPTSTSEADLCNILPATILAPQERLH